MGGKAKTPNSTATTKRSSRQILPPPPERAMKQDRIVYVLDPVLATLAITRLPDGDEIVAYKEIIGCDGVDDVRFDRTHSLYFNDEGLVDGITHYAMLEGHPDPLVGRLIIASTDKARPKPTVLANTIISRISCYRAVMDPVIETTEAVSEGMTTYVSAVTGFTLRIAPVSIRTIAPNK